MKKTFLLPISMAIVAFLVLPFPGLSAPLSSRIEEKRDQIDHHKAKEGVLSTTIQRLNTRVDAIQGEISATERRLSRVQDSLDQQKEQLLAVRNRLEAARDRLERLRSELVTARRVLAARLVEIYKADSPDALTVILSADGFGDLLERAEFLDRISDQDREITDRVRGLRDRAHDQAIQLADLEEREQLAAERILRERDEIAAVENQLVGARDQLASARADKRGALAQVHDSRVRLEGDLAALEREQARVLAAIQGGSGGTFKQGSGQLGLARERPGRLTLRDALGAPARRHRHRGFERHADPRRRRRPRDPDGLGRRLRQLHVRAAHRQPVELLRPPVELRHLQRSVGEPGSGDRLRGLHGTLLRRPPALRDARERGAGRPHGLPLAARVAGASRAA